MRQRKKKVFSFEALIKYIIIQKFGISNLFKLNLKIKLKF